MESAINPVPFSPGAKVSLPAKIDDYHMATFDPGVFQQEIRKLGIVPQTPNPVEVIGLPPPRYEEAVKEEKHKECLHDPATHAAAYEQGVQEGTLEGTAMALTETYNLTETRYMTYFDVAGIDPVFPRNDDIQKKRMIYTWTTTEDHGKEQAYPPHCKSKPSEGYRPDLTKADLGDPTNNYVLSQIFDNLALKNVQLLIPRLLPNRFIGRLGGDFLFNAYRYSGNARPTNARTVKAIEDFNRNQHNLKATGYAEPNVGLREDWFSDAVFAQQQFIGTNPTTITKASDTWLKRFTEVARRQNQKEFLGILEKEPQSSFYVQDCSYFRDAAGIEDQNAQLKASIEGSRELRYTAASVVLFHLGDNGRLHPLAIVIDYKVTMENSVTIFNKRLRPYEVPGKSAPGEADDWPWRYAKTCAQTSDWLRHELAVHLCNTHLIEECIIVAAQRSFDWNHIILRLLYPHWYKTLPLNQSARDVLVPNIIMDIVGLDKTQAFNFINYHYNKFDFQGTMVPADLENRGFPPSELESNPKFNDYGYAKNIYPLWNIIHKFVSSMLRLKYPSDDRVRNDEDIKLWCGEMRGDQAGKLKSFPESITTFNQLADVITHCIHIASPQHTAVNYLQQYYLSFVINKPAALCTPLPQSLDELKRMNEGKFIDMFPVNRPRDWLLSSHIPYLLSTRGGATKNSLAGYAYSLFQTYKEKKVVKDEIADPTGDENAHEIRDYAKAFYDDLRAFDLEWPKINAKMSDKSILYNVLDPDDTAVSILI